MPPGAASDRRAACSSHPSRPRTLSLEDGRRGPCEEIVVPPAEVNEVSLTLKSQRIEAAEAILQTVAHKADRGEVRILEERTLELHLAEKVHQVGELEFADPRVL